MLCTNSDLNSECAPARRWHNRHCSWSHCTSFGRVSGYKLSTLKWAVPFKTPQAVIHPCRIFHSKSSRMVSRHNVAPKVAPKHKSSTKRVFTVLYIRYSLYICSKYKHIFTQASLQCLLAGLSILCVMCYSSSVWMRLDRWRRLPSNDVLVDWRSGRLPEGPAGWWDYRRDRGIWKQPPSLWHGKSVCGLLLGEQKKTERPEQQDWTQFFLCDFVLLDLLFLF